MLFHVVYVLLTSLNAVELVAAASDQSESESMLQTGLTSKILMLSCLLGVEKPVKRLASCFSIGSRLYLRLVPLIKIVT